MEELYLTMLLNLGTNNNINWNWKSSSTLESTCKLTVCTYIVKYIFAIISLYNKALCSYIQGMNGVLTPN